jgi:propionyl-CoA synthetase
MADERFRATYLDPYPGYYLTADAGYIDERGYVFVMARTDDIINVAGHRLSTGARRGGLGRTSRRCRVRCDRSRRRTQGQVPVGLLVLKAGVQRPEEHIVKETVQLVRDGIGPVASSRPPSWLFGLPKTRSGKILRGTMRRIADAQQYSVPPTIDDPKILEEITDALHRVGYGPAFARPGSGG